MDTVDELKRANASSHGQGVSHKVSAIYPNSAEAQAVCQRLLDSGIAADAIDILHEHPHQPINEDSNEVLKDVLVDGAIGTAVGAGVGALGTAALWASSVTLFVASPVLAPLMMLGWFASVGGLVGAAVGAEASNTPAKDGSFSDLVKDAINAGSVVLLVRTYDEAEKELAKKIIGDSVMNKKEAVLES